MHAKRQIRDAVVNLLQANPVSWKFVYNTRIAPARDVLPYVSVWVESESIEALTIHPSPIYERTVEIIISCRHRIPTNKENLEDELDNMQVELEGKLTTTALNTEMNNKLKSLVFQSSVVSLVEDENSRIYGEDRLTLTATVVTDEGNPEILI